ncbi:MAG: NUDIX hydrolase [Beijerinckiaceae bacterium]
MTDSSGVALHHADALDCRVVDFDWRFARERADEIDRHWEVLREQRPALFNGRVFLTCGYEIAKEAGKTIFRSQHFETDFKAFIAWRDFAFADPDVAVCFSAAALRGADGGYVLGRMGDRTANAGRIYFPAGTPDPGDVRDGRLDLHGSVLRELKEETGLAPPDVVVDEGWTVAIDGPRLGCLKPVVCGRPAVVLARAIEDFLARDPEPELSGAYCVHSAADLLQGVMPDYILAYLRQRIAGDV